MQTLLVGCIGVVSGLFAWLLGNKKRSRTQTIQQYVEKFPEHHRFQQIRETTDHIQCEIFLEIRSYGWKGAYQAILFLETPDEVKLYAYLILQGDFKFLEKIITKEEFTQFVEELLEKNILDMNDHVTNLLYDGAMYLLQITKGSMQKQIRVYSPQVSEDTAVHWSIITCIQNFCFQYIQEEMGK